MAEQALKPHLETGLTTICRAWAIARKDGEVFGFTDHDCDLSFDDMAFRADTGLSALALQQTTGLSVDNTEAIGALADASLREEDILAGKFDGAEVRAWLVNWAAPEMRDLVFRGHIGALTRIDGAFRAEVRGLSEALGRPLGRAIGRGCSAVLGDDGCQFDVTREGYHWEGEITSVDGRAAVLIAAGDDFIDGWFQHGAGEMLSGGHMGSLGGIKRDDIQGDGARRIEFWEPFKLEIAVGDRLKLIAGCDKSQRACIGKFANFLNFQGFPDVPEDDWILTPAPSAPAKTGGSRR